MHDGSFFLDRHCLLAPISRRLLGDELNVEEGALARPERVTRCCAPDDPRRHVGHNVLVQGERLGHGESPAGGEGAADHGPGGGGGRGGEAERVGEFEAAHLQEEMGSL